MAEMANSAAPWPLEPACSDLLRREYADIVPGYYMNKTHWSTAYLDGKAPREVLADMVTAAHRVAMTAFGPDTCYYVVGKNKIMPDLSAALARCKNVAAPLNAKRLDAKTPCAKNGDKCYGCDSPNRICRITVITDRAPLGMKSEVVFVDEDLGL